MAEDYMGMTRSQTQRGVTYPSGPGDLAPAPQSPERVNQVYERSLGANRGGNKGPLRFQEGIATDTDVPNDFVRGMTEGQNEGQARYNHNDPNTQYKQAAETMKERVHVGSASWIEAPTFLGEFAYGAMSGYGVLVYEQADRSGGRFERHNPAQIG